MIPTSFAHPLWLYALALPALLAVWELTRQPRKLVLPLDHGRARAGFWLGRLLRAAAVLPALLLAAAIVLMAGPQRPDRPGEERVLTNMEFVMDVSGSMTSPFGEGTRYDGSIAAIQAFTTHRQGDAFGLTIFGNEVLHWTPLTKDLNAVRAAAPFLRPEHMPPQFGGTEIGKAVRASLVRMRQRGQGGIMVLISDGQSADLSGDTARRIGGELAAASVVMYAIHVGGDRAPKDLHDLAGPSGGQVFAARNPAALDAIFTHIDRLQPAKLRPTAPLPIEACGLPALIGLVLLSLQQLAAFGLRYTPW